MFLLSYLCTEKSSFFLSYHTIEMGIGRGFVMNRPFSRMNQPWGVCGAGWLKGWGWRGGYFNLARGEVLGLGLGLFQKNAAKIPVSLPKSRFFRGSWAYIWLGRKKFLPFGKSVGLQAKNTGAVPTETVPVFSLLIYYISSRCRRSSVHALHVCRLRIWRRRMHPESSSPARFQRRGRRMR